MQASFYNYSTTSASNQNYDTTVDQGTWQQPAAVQNSGLHQQDSAYYTGVISGAPQSYYTGTTTGNTASVGGTFARGAKTSTAKSPKLTSGNVSISQTQSGAQYGSNMTQYVASSLFQENAVGSINNSSSEAGYYGYPSDQYITHSGNGMMGNDSYSTMGLGIGNSSGGIAMDNTTMSMGSSSGIGTNSIGGAGMCNTGDNMGMNSIGMGSSGSINMAGGNLGVGNNEDISMGSNRGMGMAYKGGGMSIGSGGNIDHQNNQRYNMGMGENMRHTSHSYNHDYDGFSSDYYVYRNNDSSYENFRGRGSRFQNRQRVPMSGSRGRFNSGSRGDLKSNFSFGNNVGVGSYRKGGRGFNSSSHHHGRELNKGLDVYHSTHLGGREGSLTIHLNAAYYNQWCYLRKKFGKRDNELAEHLLDIHDKYCNGCKERIETKKPASKRKISEEAEETSVIDDIDEELTEEEVRMKELMGFAGFKSTKGSKPKDISFSAADCAKTCAKSSEETKGRESALNTTLTPEERRAMASLGGFSVFVKTDAVNAASVGFGAPAITFTPMNDSDNSNIPS